MQICTFVFSLPKFCIISLVSKSEISNVMLADWFVSELFENFKDMFSRNEAHIFFFVVFQTSKEESEIASLARAVSFYTTYSKSPKFLDTRKLCCNHPKILTNWLYSREMSPKDADGIANSEDPDQTAPLGAV